MLSTTQLGLASMIDPSVLKTGLTLSAPLLGHFLAWVIKELEKRYEYHTSLKKTIRYRKDLQYQLDTVPNLTPKKRKELEDAISKCNQYIGKLMIGH